MMAHIVMKNFVQKYWSETEGLAAVEAALLFPALLVILVSTVDIGNAFVSNQKVITAAQTTADLITREENPTLDERADAIKAGQLAMSPYSLTTYEYIVVSYRFANNGSPEVVWQESSGGTEIDADMTNGLTDLGGPGEGVVVVKIEYVYTPFFTGFVIGDIPMKEVAYLRGRKSPIVGNPL